MRMRCSSRGRIEAIRFKVNLPNYGVFDEKRVFAPGPLPGPVKLSRRSARAAGLRGYLDRLGRLRERGRVSGRNRRGDCCWCRTARPTGGTRTTSASTSRSRASPRSACRSFTSISSAARTNWCSTAPRSRSTPIARSPFSCRRSPRRSSPRTGRAPMARLALHRRTDRKAGRGGQIRLRGLHARLARLCRQEPLSGVVLGLSGGIDSALCAAHGDRCARRRPRALRDAAVPLHGAGIARRCRRDRARAWRALRRGADRERRDGARTGACRRVCRTMPRATSPRKICSRAPAARS